MITIHALSYQITPGKIAIYVGNSTASIRAQAIKDHGLDYRSAAMQSETSVSQKDLQHIRTEELFEGLHSVVSAVELVTFGVSQCMCLGVYDEQLKPSSLPKKDGFEAIQDERLENEAKRGTTRDTGRIGSVAPRIHSDLFNGLGLIG